MSPAIHEVPHHVLEQLDTVSWLRIQLQGNLQLALQQILIKLREQLAMGLSYTT